MRFEHFLVCLDLAKHYGAYGKDEARHREAGGCQHMMHEPTVNPTVAIFEWMGVYEAERLNGGRGNCIHASTACALVERDDSVDERFKVLRASTDVFRDRRLSLPIMLSDKSALRSQPELDESIVFNYLPLQSLELRD